MGLVVFAVFIRNVKGLHHECRNRLGSHVKVQDAIAKARGSWVNQQPSGPGSRILESIAPG